jgi:U-box domain
MVQSGRSFERSAILQWLGRGNLTCPLTRQPMHLSDLVSNHALQIKIQKWKLEQQYVDETDGETEDSSDSSEDDLVQSYGIMQIYISSESINRYYSRASERQRRQRRQINEAITRLASTSSISTSPRHQSQVRRPRANNNENLISTTGRQEQNNQSPRGLMLLRRMLQNNNA